MSLLHGTRTPAVAGSFYPAERDRLFEEIHRCFTHSLGPGFFPSAARVGGIDEEAQKVSTHSTRCLIVPHAGYMYSGPVAAHSYLQVSNFIASSPSEEFVAIVLGPNHYGLGSGVALSRNEAWETPLGTVQVSREISKQMLDSSSIVDIDDLAHLREHSIEVQIPFLQALATQQKRTFKLLPICLMLQDRETAQQVSESILSILRKKDGPSCLVLGSSDLTHYEAQRNANTKDRKLLSAVEKLDVLEFYKVLERENVTACGYGAIASVMYIAIGLGMKKGSVLKYATSGDVTGDESSVVGYSAVEFH